MNRVKIPDFNKYIDAEEYERCLRAKEIIEKSQKQIDEMLEPHIQKWQNGGYQEGTENIMAMAVLAHIETKNLRQEMLTYTRMNEMIFSVILEMIKDLDQSVGTTKRHYSQIRKIAKKMDAMRVKNIGLNEKYGKMDFVVEGISAILKARGISLEELMKDKTHHPSLNNSKRTPRDGTQPISL